MKAAIPTIINNIAEKLSVKPQQIASAVKLLDEGATVPFISRYRKEITEGLNDVQLRFLADRLAYLRDLDERCNSIIAIIKEQEKLTPELEQALISAETKARLEDLYLPYRLKRRTKATAAKEAGLEPLALLLWKNPENELEKVGADFVNHEAGIFDAATALEGARQILLEHFAQEADLLEHLRNYFWQHAHLKSTKTPLKATKKTKSNAKLKNNAEKFHDYFEYNEALNKIPSHRALALFRGRREEVLQLALYLPQNTDYPQNFMSEYFNLHDKARPADVWLHTILAESWKARVQPKIELELFARLREIADEEAIRVFSHNLRDLLLAAPAGPKVTMGLDPGIRTGVKAAIVDVTGKLLDYATIFPLSPQNEWQESIATLAKLAAKYHVSLISIGNGTGSRETERLISELIHRYPDLNLTKVIVSEAGASVYSASVLASEEFPDLDVTLRGAISIARRLQDPLAELVKIDPKAIGVGQYQHDVNPTRLAHSLKGVVEDCVNAVGVDVNTASVSLLTHVAGLNAAAAKHLVDYRKSHGAFNSRDELKKVPQIGEKTFQQAAGFLRIADGSNALDASGVHPESYRLINQISADYSIEIQALMHNAELLNKINAENYVDDQFGLPTIRDVLHELEKPGRDPRPLFKTVKFKDGVESITHLEIGMILEGVVSNVTNFGAFVDIGVHQDGLVHISALTHQFIRDPRSIVKAGEIVTVKVIEVDKERKRISLSMNFTQEKPLKKAKQLKKPSPPPKAAQMLKTPQKKNPARPIMNTAMADALSQLKRG
jgi:uncharacterized protein